jgi:starch phosphorylase
MVAEYTRRFYNPAMARWRYLTENSMARARELAKWKTEIRGLWPEFAVKDVVMEITNGEVHEPLNPKQPQLNVGSQLSVRALVKLGKVSPNDVSVELYHGPVDSWGNINDGSAVKMDYKEPSNHDGEHWFAGSMNCRMTGQHGAALRVMPRHPDLVDPYEMGLVLWETTAEKPADANLAERQ